MSRTFFAESFLEFLNYPDSDTTHKINGFLPQNSSTRFVFGIEFKMEEFKIVMAEEYKFEIVANKKK